MGERLVLGIDPASKYRRYEARFWPVDDTLRIALLFSCLVYNVASLIPMPHHSFVLHPRF